MADDEFYRKRAMRRLGIAAAVVVIVVGVAFYVIRSGSFQEIAAIESSAERIAAGKLSDNFSAPAPLIATGTAKTPAGANAASGRNEYTLTRAGVIADTNAARAANTTSSPSGILAPLQENATLDDIAQIRLDDMFAKQYFAHISPSSSSAVTVAQAVGYDYLELGENLALGNFVGDQGVVTAWMNSPGHRANILDPLYDEIGVAVGDGDFQGKEAWIAVQVFGRPMSDCPAPSATLKTQITSDQNQAAQMQSELQAEHAQVEAMQPQSGDAYNEAVNNYNAQVDQYNNLVAQAKSEVAEYNGEVAAYNECIGPANEPANGSAPTSSQSENPQE